MRITQRSVSLLLAPALFLGLLGAGCSSDMSTTTSSTSQTVTSSASSQKASELKMAMRRLWEDHITWTRLYIISVADNLNDTDETAARLMKNQEDIGNAIKPYYGTEAGNQVTALLKEHISGAVKILAAAKANNQAELASSTKAWRDNGDEIAAYLNKANPESWPLSTMQAAMKTHLDTTMQEAQDRLAKKYSADIADYDAVKDHIYMMSDVLSDGIIKQFPDKF